MNKREFLHIPMLILSALLVSCSTTDDLPETHADTLPAEVVITNPEAGKIVTLLDEAVKITDCEMAAEESNTRHNPPIFFDGGTMYIYKYPAFTAIAGMPGDQANAYLNQYLAETTEHTYEIEVYNDPASSQASRIIPLQGLNGDRINFYQLFKSDDSLILFGTENKDGLWLPHSYEFSMDGNLLDRSHLNDVPEFADFYPVGNCIYYCDPDSGRFSLENTVYDLYRYDRKTGESTVADERGVILLFESAGVLYCLTPGDTPDALILSSVTEEGFTEIHTFPSPLSGINGAEYNAEKQILYLSDYRNLYTVHADDNTPRKILFSGDRSIHPEGITDDWILIRNGGYAITAYHQPEGKISLDDNQEVLRIFCPKNIWSDRYQNDIPQMMNLNDYHLCTKETTVSDMAEYTNTLAKKLLAGDTDFDIFYVSTETSELLKGKYYENLSQYPILQDYYDSMIPGAGNLCTVDGVTALVPIGLYTFCMQVNPEVSDLNPASLRTWDDLLAAKESLDLSDDACIMAEYTPQNLVRSTFKLLITNYMNDIIDDEQAKADLDMLYRMAEEFGSDPYFDVTKEDGFRTPFLSEMQNNGKFARLAENRTAIPLLGMTDEYRQSWTGSFWAVNPNSKNKELAAAYLAYFIENNLTIPGSAGDLYNREPIMGTLYEMTYNEEMFDLFCAQLKDGVLAYELPDYTGYFNRQFADIKAGKLTREEAADDLFRWLRMLKFE